jgi:two-component system response regulator AtoC
MLLRAILAIQEPSLRKRIGGLLPQDEVIVETVETRRRLWERMVRKSCDLVIASKSVIPEPDAHKIRLLRELPESPAILVLAETVSPEEEARFRAAGYDGLLCSYLPDDQLRAELVGILSQRRERALRLLAAGPVATPHPRLEDFVSRSSVMQACLAVASRVVDSDVSLLILGETGVGKEHLARAIHADSPRDRGPFVAVNCGAFPESLLESALFGHEEGAFTGATRAQRGCFELAHHGVLFLDEIADVPAHMQGRLLRVLQDHEITRLGSEKPFAVDVRVIAATNKDLAKEVEAGRFRRDLYYRLNVLSLTIPPLRERREDIPDLADDFLRYLRPRVGRNVKRVTAEAMEALKGYSWPGNVRELINVLERGMLLCGDEEITLGDLPDSIRHAGSSRTALVTAPSGDSISLPGDWLGRPLQQVREEVTARVEKAYLTRLLRSTHGRVGRTAKLAGIQPRSLYDKMRLYGLRKEEFRQPGTDSK